MFKKITSLCVLFCFIFNVTISDYAHSYTPMTADVSTVNLSAASINTDMLGTEHKDVGRLKMSLEADLMQLFAFKRQGADVDFSSFEKFLGDRVKKDEDLYEPADLHFFFHEAEETDDGVKVKCRVHDEAGTRTYFALIDFNLDSDKGFPIKDIYLETEEKKLPKAKMKNIMFEGRKNHFRKQYISRIEVLSEIIRTIEQHPDDDGTSDRDISRLARASRLYGHAIEGMNGASSMDEVKKVREDLEKGLKEIGGDHWKVFFSNGDSEEKSTDATGDADKNVGSGAEDQSAKSESKWNRAKAFFSENLEWIVRNSVPVIFALTIWVSALVFSWESDMVVLERSVLNFFYGFSGYVTYVITYAFWNSVLDFFKLFSKNNETEDQAAKSESRWNRAKAFFSENLEGIVRNSVPVISGLTVWAGYLVTPSEYNMFELEGIVEGFLYGFAGCVVYVITYAFWNPVLDMFKLFSKNNDEGSVNATGDVDRSQGPGSEIQLESDLKGGASLSKVKDAILKRARASKKTLVIEVLGGNLTMGVGKTYTGHALARMLNEQGISAVHYDYDSYIDLDIFYPGVIRDAKKSGEYKVVISSSRWGQELWGDTVKVDTRIFVKTDAIMNLLFYAKSILWPFVPGKSIFFAMESSIVRALHLFAFLPMFFPGNLISSKKDMSAANPDMVVDNSVLKWITGSHSSESQVEAALNATGDVDKDQGPGSQESRKEEVIRLANERGLKLADADIEDLNDPFFLNVTSHYLETAGKIGLDDEVFNKIYSPDRVTEVKIPVRMDSGETGHFNGYRIMHNGARGAGKGGIRFHPAVTRGMVRALSTDMTWKNAIVGIPYGGGKGGIAVDPREMSEREMEQLCRGFIRELLKQNADAVGVLKDVPAPDVGSTAQHMAWMRDEYERITGTSAAGIITGKPIPEGGSEGRTKATGQGVFFSAREAIRSMGDTLGMGADMTKCSYSFQGAGNVAFEAIKIFFASGCSNIQYMSDVSGAIYMKDGVTQDLLDKLEAHLSSRGLLEDFNYEGVEHMPGNVVLEAKVDVLIPAALQNQIRKDNADKIQARLIVEGANGPTTPEADHILKERGVVAVPDILANAGGVTVSYLEWLQNIQDEHWNLVAIDKMLEYRMVKAFENVYKTSRAYGISMREAANYLALMRVADAEVARDSLLQERFGQKKPYKAKIELFAPDTYEQLNRIVEDKKFNELIEHLESRKREEVSEIALGVEKRFAGKRGVVLVNGPMAVGKAMFSHNLKRELESMGRKAKVIHFEQRNILDLKRLLNGGTVGLTPEDQYYYGTSDKTLSIEDDEIIIIEGHHVFGGRVDQLLEVKGLPKYKIFLNTAPCMKLRDNYPFTSLHARMLRSIMDALLTVNKRPSETLMRFLRQRKGYLDPLYKSWGETDRSVELFQAYELPIFKRELWDDLLEDITSVRTELSRVRGEKDNSGYVERLEKALGAMEELKYLLEPVQAASEEVAVPKTAILRQFLKVRKAAVVKQAADDISLDATGDVDKDEGPGSELQQTRYAEDEWRSGEAFDAVKKAVAYVVETSSLQESGKYIEDIVDRMISVGLPEEWQYDYRFMVPSVMNVIDLGRMLYIKKREEVLSKEKDKNEWKERIETTVAYTLLGTAFFVAAGSFGFTFFDAPLTAFSAGLAISLSFGILGVFWNNIFAVVNAVKEVKKGSDADAEEDEDLEALRDAMDLELSKTVIGKKIDLLTKWGDFELRNVIDQIVLWKNGDADSIDKKELEEYAKDVLLDLRKKYEEELITKGVSAEELIYVADIALDAADVSRELRLGVYDLGLFDYFFNLSVETMTRVRRECAIRKFPGMRLPRLAGRREGMSDESVAMRIATYARELSRAEEVKSICQKRESHGSETLLNCLSITKPPVDFSDPRINILGRMTIEKRLKGMAEFMPAWYGQVVTQGEARQRLKRGKEMREGISVDATGDVDKDMGPGSEDYEEDAGEIIQAFNDATGDLETAAELLDMLPGELRDRIEAIKEVAEENEDYDTISDLEEAMNFYTYSRHEHLERVDPEDAEMFFATGDADKDQGPGSEEGMNLDVFMSLLDAIEQSRGDDKTVLDALNELRSLVKDLSKEDLSRILEEAYGVAGQFDFLKRCVKENLPASIQKGVLERLKHHIDIALSNLSLGLVSGKVPGTDITLQMELGLEAEYDSARGYFSGVMDYIQRVSPEEKKVLEKNLKKIKLVRGSVNMVRDHGRVLEVVWPEDADDRAAMIEMATRLLQVSYFRAIPPSIFADMMSDLPENSKDLSGGNDEYHVFSDVAGHIHMLKFLLSAIGNENENKALVLQYAMMLAEEEIAPGIKVFREMRQRGALNEYGIVFCSNLNREYERAMAALQQMKENIDPDEDDRVEATGDVDKEQGPGSEASEDKIFEANDHMQGLMETLRYYLEPDTVVNEKTMRKIFDVAVKNIMDMGLDARSRSYFLAKIAMLASGAGFNDISRSLLGDIEGESSKLAVKNCMLLSEEDVLESSKDGEIRHNLLRGLLEKFGREILKRNLAELVDENFFDATGDVDKGQGPASEECSKIVRWLIGEFSVTTDYEIETIVRSILLTLGFRSDDQAEELNKLLPHHKRMAGHSAMPVDRAHRAMAFVELTETAFYYHESGESYVAPNRSTLELLLGFVKKDIDPVSEAIARTALLALEYDPQEQWGRLQVLRSHAESLLFKPVEFGSDRREARKVVDIVDSVKDKLIKIDGLGQAYVDAAGDEDKDKGPGTDAGEFLSVDEVERLLGGEEDDIRTVDELIAELIKVEINEMLPVASQVGMGLARPVIEKEYTLFVSHNMFKGDEYDEDKYTYASRFNLQRIKTDDPDRIVERVLGKISSLGIDPSTVIVQLPKVFSEDVGKAALEKLMAEAPEVRFMVIDTEGMKLEDNRAAHRRNVYSLLLVARSINADTPKDSALYTMMRFFMKACLGDDKRELISAYIDALAKNEISAVIRTVLSYKPIQEYQMPDYDQVSATLIAA